MQDAAASVPSASPCLVETEGPVEQVDIGQSAALEPSPDGPEQAGHEILRTRFFHSILEAGIIRRSTEHMLRLADG